LSARTAKTGQAPRIAGASEWSHKPDTELLIGSGITKAAIPEITWPQINSLCESALDSALL